MTIQGTTLAGLLLIASQIAGDVSACAMTSVDKVEVVENKAAELEVEVTYCMESDKADALFLALSVDGKGKEYSSFARQDPEAGQHVVKMTVSRQFHHLNAYQTHAVTAYLVGRSNNYIFDSIQLPFEKSWRGLTGDKNKDAELLEATYQKVVEWIDDGGKTNLNNAKQIIDTVLERYPQQIDMYPEWARFEMKMNGVGTQASGTIAAQSILENALNLSPNHTNSMILLGYVYTWRQKYEQAIQLFEQADKQGTQNWWLYTNWGENLIHQQKYKQAEAILKKAVKQPLAYNTYDRAIMVAFDYLAETQEKLKKYPAAKQTYLDGFAKFSKRECFQVKALGIQVKYLSGLEDPENLRNASQLKQCRDQYKGYLAIGYMRLWYDNIQKHPDAAAKFIALANLNQVNKTLMVADISELDKGQPILEKMTESKINIDPVDRDGLTPLALEIIKKNVKAVRHLLDAGADVDVSIGPNKLTPLMLAVIQQDVKMIRILRTRVKHPDAKNIMGQAAVDIARQIGNVEIVELLSNSPAET